MEIFGHNMRHMCFSSSVLFLKSILTLLSSSYYKDLQSQRSMEK